MTERCDRCKEVDDDRRHLLMSCGYAMDEIDVPFDKKSLVDGEQLQRYEHKFFSLTVCKSCRSDWMHAIEDWFNNYVEKPSCGSGIFIRDFGANREITDEQWNMLRPDVEPVRCR